jgi:IPT/TIG domain-containing protein/S-layer family protein
VRRIPSMLLLGFATSLSANTFTVINTNDSGAGTLRQAILDANANPGLDTIAFNITGSGVHTIQPLLSTMFITDPVVIDGFTQAGSSPNTLLVGNDAVYTVEIDGSGLTNTLFYIQTSGATIRGLLINRVPGYSISTNGGLDDIKVIGNWIGTDITGTQYLGTGNTAVLMAGSNSQVGGTDPADHNLIVGGGTTLDIEVGGFNVIQGNHVGLNAAGTAVLAPSPPPSYGIALIANAHDNLIGGTVPGARNVVFANAPLLLGSGSNHDTIQGNYLGTDATGTVSMGATVGIETNNAPHDDLIGGSAAGAGNVISGNVIGIHFADGAAANAVMGNFIGTDPTGLLPVPNTAYGIQIATLSAGSAIGGTNTGEGNTIAFNGSTGVLVSSSTGWPIRGNSIHSNAGLGIDLENPGPKPNDPGDADDGPNHLQNFPILKTVTILAPQGTGTRIQGKLDSTPSTTFDLDFYANAACSNFPREFLQGETYLGSAQVTTDATGHAVIDVTLSATIQPGQKVSATATDPGGSTSEFSQRIIFSIAPASGPPEGGDGLLVSGTDFSNPTTITIDGADAAASFVNDHTLTATSPAFAAGTFHDVVATTTDGTTGTLVNGWVADFLDVPGGHQFHSFVTTLVSNAITVGIGAGLYGVDQGTKRQQMAVFLLKGKHGLCYTPPPCAGVFPDVPCPSTFAPWIEALAAEGITTGCGGGLFCPQNLVTRRQMAVFLLKTEHGSTYSPPACAGVFDDVPCPGAPAVEFIEQLAAEQITGGCSASPPLYCPDGTSTRGQMAVFITKTFHLQ